MTKRTWQSRELVTQLFLGGKSATEIGFPEKWEHDPLVLVWNSIETYQSERNGVSERIKFCLSDKLVRESNWL